VPEAINPHCSNSNGLGIKRPILNPRPSTLNRINAHCSSQTAGHWYSLAGLVHANMQQQQGGGSAASSSTTDSEPECAAAAAGSATAAGARARVGPCIMMMWENVWSLSCSSACLCVQVSRGKCVLKVLCLHTRVHGCFAEEQQQGLLLQQHLQHQLHQHILQQQQQQQQLLQQQLRVHTQIHAHACAHAHIHTHTHILHQWIVEAIEIGRGARRKATTETSLCAVHTLTKTHNKRTYSHTLAHTRAHRTQQNQGTGNNAAAGAANNVLHQLLAANGMFLQGANLGAPCTASILALGGWFVLFPKSQRA
jgi:hypothetical protein